MSNKRRTYRETINGTRGILTVRNKEPGFTYRIINDDQDRVAELQERGYEIVQTKTQVGDKRVAIATPEGSPVQIRVGQGKVAYLMRIKDEFYEEDKRAKHDRINELESTLIGSPDGDYGKVKVERGS